jgi:peptidoglycan LD-endopeptidase LytH
MIRGMKARPDSTDSIVVPEIEVPEITLPEIASPEKAALPRSASADTSEIVASPLELADLKASLVMPLAGIRIEDIPDSFNEARGTRPHEALDIMAPRGTPVLSAARGRILKLYQSPSGGLMIYASDASNRFILMYAHLDAYAPGLAEGALVRQGQPIGYVGSTGNAAPDAPHLHFGIARGRPDVQWWRGTPVNPHPLLVR